MLDYDGCLPVFMQVTEGKTQDMQVARSTSIPSGSVLVVDRTYVDFKWLKESDNKDVYLVTRLKANTQYDVFEPYTTGQENENIRILEGVKIGLSQKNTAKSYPKKLRLMRKWDHKKQRELTFLTNNFYWTALMVDRSRWDTKGFFKKFK